MDQARRRGPERGVVLGVVHLPRWSRKILESKLGLKKEKPVTLREVLIEAGTTAAVLGLTTPSRRDLHACGVMAGLLLYCTPGPWLNPSGLAQLQQNEA